MMTDTMLNGFFLAENGYAEHILQNAVMLSAGMLIVVVPFIYQNEGPNQFFFAQPQPNDAINDLC
jgi:hypothetical protein